MNKQALAAAGLVVAIAGSWILIYRAVFSDKIDVGEYEALGRGAALQSAEALRDGGSIVLVDAQFGDYQLLAPITAAEIKAFKSAISKTRVKIAGIEKVPIAPPSMARTGVFMQPGQLRDVIARNAGADAFVLFVGLAGLEDAESALPKGGKPKVVIVGNFEPYYKGLLQRGIVQRAIVPRQDGGVDGAKAAHERYFRVITPENAAEMTE